MDESAARFKENAELVDQLWTGEPLHWSGQFRPSINGESLQPARSRPPATACGSAAEAPWSPSNSPPAWGGS
ncbi:hypothetical protein ACR6C2_01715 [Streptomyces sp. INA 01156]